MHELCEQSERIPWKVDQLQADIDTRRTTTCIDNACTICMVGIQIQENARRTIEKYECMTKTLELSGKSTGINSTRSTPHYYILAHTG